MPDIASGVALRLPASHGNNRLFEQEAQNDGEDDERDRADGGDADQLTLVHAVFVLAEERVHRTGERTGHAIRLAGLQDDNTDEPQLDQHEDDRSVVVTTRPRMF